MVGTTAVRVACALSVAVLLLVRPAAAQDTILTLVEGSAVVIDGAMRWTAVPGLRPGPGALIETSATTSVVRLEWPDRTTVDLGPDTQAMILPPGFEARDGRPPVLYLLHGWAKVGAPPKDPAGGVVAPGMEILPFVGAVVAFVDRRERFAFAESGSLEVSERNSPGKRHAVAAGALYSAGGVLPRPTAAWLKQVPRAFRDPLPYRATAFRDRTVNAAALPAPTFALLSHWLTAEPVLRRDFPRRFSALVHDPVSRRALEAQRASLPEWKPLLDAPR